MPRSSGILSFPDFRGFTRKLILWNLVAYFILALVGLASVPALVSIISWLALVPSYVLHGRIWQLLTYSFIHQGILGTALELLSLWFMGSFLESNHGPRWLAEIYFSSVLGTGLAAIAIFLFMPSSTVVLSGCYGGLFGLLIAIGVLYGDLQFMMFPLPIMIKAKYLAAVFLLIALASLFSTERAYAFAQLGGALFGYLYIRFAPRRGFAFASSQQFFGWRNNYYRWKRRRAARKFEVYMRKQGRTVRFDGQGHLIDEEQDDKKRWN
jgi:membrane associated rhomboid family serine protease